MITLTITVIALLALLLVSALGLGLAGGITLIVFGDVIIFAVIAGLVIRYFVKKRKKGGAE